MPMMLGTVLDGWLFGSGVTVVLGVISALAAAWLVQRCPHCRGFVRRSRSRRWLRCPRCGRQYNATVKRLRA